MLLLPLLLLQPAKCLMSFVSLPGLVATEFSLCMRRRATSLWSRTMQMKHFCNIFHHDNLLLLELQSEEDSDLHESCVEYLSDSLRNHSSKLESLTGLSRLLKLHGAKRRLGRVPDLLCKKDWIWGKNHLVTVVAEVSYGVPLRLTHPHIAEYFAEYPTLRTGLIISIEYPWRKYPTNHQHENFYDISNGKIIIFRYDHPNFDCPSSAISFATPLLMRMLKSLYVRLALLSAASLVLELAIHQLVMLKYSVIPGSYW